MTRKGPAALQNRHSIRFPNAPHYVPLARRVIVEFARTCGLPERASDDLTCAVGEALANAVEHGFRDRTYFAVRCWREGDAILVEVEDDGRGFDPDERLEPDGNATRGYGITIMRSLVDEVTFKRNGRLVRLRKALVENGQLDDGEPEEEPERKADLAG